MSDPFIGQIIAAGFNFAPVGWLFCNGQLVSIADYQMLYALIGTTYGGDGQATFGVPNLQGKVALGYGQGGTRSNYLLGQTSGLEEVTLTVPQTGMHSHLLNAVTSAGDTVAPGPNLMLATAGAPASVKADIYATGAGNTTLVPSSIGAASGGAQPHENRQPFQVLNYIICYQGIYPAQS